MDNPHKSSPDGAGPEDSWVMEDRRLRGEVRAKLRRRRQRGEIGATLISLVLALNGFAALLLVPTRINPWLAVLLLFLPAIILAASAVSVMRRLR